MNHLKIFKGFFGKGIGLFQGPYLYSTRQKNGIIHHDASEIQTRDPSVPAVEGSTHFNGTGFK
jgi:hypothetical protein